MTQQRRASGAAALGILLGICLLLLAANLWRLNQPPRPDPKMVGLAVRATLFAVPSPTPYLIEVTRVVEVVVTATPLSTATPLPAATWTPTPTLTAAPTETPTDEPVSAAPANPFVAAAADEMGPAARQAQVDEAIASAAEAAPEVAAAEPAAAPQAEANSAPEPAPETGVGDCPPTSNNTYTTVPVAGGGLSHPPSLHADLNLAVRGYAPSDAVPVLFDKDGLVDGDPPQLAGIFGDYRRPSFGAAFRVYDWDWSCGEHGCRSGLVQTGASTLLTLLANGGETLGIPHRGAQIYGGGYKALVLYAESSRITLGYTREDSVANGYVVHLESICVDPNLLALYESSNANGRASLPALREDETLGTAGSGQIMVAVRDRGVFFDPRSRLDWWQGF